jgi:hypothetical protein
MAIQFKEQAVGIAEAFIAENPRYPDGDVHYLLVAVTPPSERYPRWVVIFNVAYPDGSPVDQGIVSVLVHAETGATSYAPLI